MRCTPVLGIILAFSIRPLQSLIMGPEFLNKQSMLTVWRNCIGDSLARVLEMERKDAVNDCRNDDLIDIDDIRTRGGGVRANEDDRREGGFINLNELAQTNVRNNDVEGGFFAGQTDDTFPQSFDDSNEDHREISNDEKEFYSERNVNKVDNKFYNNGDSDKRNNERGSVVNKNNPSEASRKINKNPSSSNENTHFSLRNAATFHTASGRKAVNNRTFNTRGKGKNHFPLFDVLSPKNRRIELEEIPSFRSRTSKEKKPIYFTLIDQSPFLPLSEESSEFLDRSKRQASSPRRPLSFSVQELIEGENELRAHLSNFSCVLKQLNLVDRSSNLMFDKIINDIKGYQIDPHLKRDLLESAQDCWTITNSLPNDDDDTLIPQSLERAYHFFKCTEARRLLSCLKKDVREDLRQAVPSSVDSFDVERTVKRIMYIKMANSFSDIMSSL